MIEEKSTGFKAGCEKVVDRVSVNSDLPKIFLLQRHKIPQSTENIPKLGYHY